MSSSEQPTGENNTVAPVPKPHTFRHPFSHSHKYETIDPSKDVEYNAPYIRHPSRKPSSNASAPASEAAETGKYISEVDVARYAEFMKKTQGMTAEETKAYLASQPDDNVGAKAMRGLPGYMQVTGAFGGTM